MNRKYPFKNESKVKPSFVTIDPKGILGKDMLIMEKMMMLQPEEMAKRIMKIRKCTHSIVIGAQESGKMKG